MDERQWLAERFEHERPRLRAVAYRMLGSLAEADDAVQDAWLRLSHAGSDEVENLPGWLTTIVARVCLNKLRSRRVRKEEPLESGLPDPIVSRDGELQPEEQTLLADSVGLAVLVILDTLEPAERLAFVLHDVFDYPFADIAALIGKTPGATRQLASRARRRVKAGNIAVEKDLDRQWAVVDAFFSAARAGNIESLVSLLDPNVVLRSDFGTARPPIPPIVRGAEPVAKSALFGATLPQTQLHRALVNGAAGMVITARGRPFVVMGFIVADGRIAEIDAIADSTRVGRIAAPVLSAPEEQETRK